MNARAGAIRLVAIAGIRSQYIKLASLQAGVRRWNRGSSPHFELISVNAGQHYSPTLAAQYLSEYSISIDHDLTVRHVDEDPDVKFGSMYVQTVRLLRAIANVNAVIIFGDANTTLAAALAAWRANLPIVHVESGLRTGTKSDEELNRIVADHVADLLLVSSKHDWQHIVSENLTAKSRFVGDIVRDLVEPRPSGENLDLGQARVLVTIHRSENLKNGDLIDTVFSSLARLNLRSLFLAHPRVLLHAETVAKSYGELVQVAESVPHQRLLQMIKHCRFVVTDSGALQRESYYLNRRALVIQDAPLWRGLVDAGFHIRCDPTAADILEGLKTILSCDSPESVQYVDFGEPPIAEKILEEIASWIQRSKAEELLF